MRASSPGAPTLEQHHGWAMDSILCPERVILRVTVEHGNGKTTTFLRGENSSCVVDITRHVEGGMVYSTYTSSEGDGNTHFSEWKSNSAFGRLSRSPATVSKL